MRVAIATDCNSGITVSEADSLGIFSLPMPVIIDGEVYIQGENLSQDFFYESLEYKDVTTSQPSPGNVLELWDRILASGYDEIVYIPMSSGLSSSCETAIGLAEEYDGRVEVADNHRISITQRRSVYDAMSMAEKGYSAKQIREKLEEKAYDQSIYIAVNTLEYLKRSGRVTASGAALGTVLNIKPVLTIQGGKLDAHAKVRGAKKAEEKIIESIRDDLNTRFAYFPSDRIEVLTAGSFRDPADEEKWRKKVGKAFPDYGDVIYNPLSFSIGSHVGPDAFAIGIVVKEEG